MSANFYAAILSFTVTLAAVLTFGSLRQPELSTVEEPPPGRIPISVTAPTLLWALLVSGTCLLLNVIFR